MAEPADRGVVEVLQDLPVDVVINESTKNTVNNIEVAMMFSIFIAAILFFIWIAWKLWGFSTGESDV